MTKRQARRLDQMRDLADNVLRRLYRRDRKAPTLGDVADAMPLDFVDRMATDLWAGRVLAWSDWHTAQGWRESPQGPRIAPAGSLAAQQAVPSLFDDPSAGRRPLPDVERGQRPSD